MEVNIIMISGQFYDNCWFQSLGKMTVSVILLKICNDSVIRQNQSNVSSQMSTAAYISSAPNLAKILIFEQS